jgi:hypothetical protein
MYAVSKKKNPNAASRSITVEIAHSLHCAPTAMLLPSRLCPLTSSTLGTGRVADYRYFMAMAMDIDMILGCNDTWLAPQLSDHQSLVTAYKYIYDYSAHTAILLTRRRCSTLCVFCQAAFPSSLVTFKKFPLLSSMVRSNPL